MDGSRFDALARHVGRHATRRSAVRFLSGAVVALGLGGCPGLAEAKKNCRLVGEPCGKGEGKRGRCCRGAVCTGGRRGGGTCVCPQGRQECRGFCVDSGSDPQACGPTCEVCPDDTDCCEGICCKEGQRCCEGKCIDLTADNDHCGGCGQVCPQGLTCCDSRCRVFNSDPRHCGGCNQRCGDNETCVNRQCVCREGYADCGVGVCRFLLNDTRNCGGCGEQCAAHEACVQGTCVSCTAACPQCCDGCGLCLRLVDGTTVCSGSTIHHCRMTCTATNPCAADDVCTVNVIHRRTNGVSDLAADCGLPPGTAICTTISSCAGDRR